MALVIPPNHYQVLIPVKHNALLRSAAITFGIRDEDTQLAPVDIADAVLNALSGAMLNQFDGGVTVGPVTLTFEQGQEGRGSITGNDVFDGNSQQFDSAPPQVAVLVKKITSRVGRPGRGRFFLPWVISRTDVMETGTITGAARQNMQGLMDDFLANLQEAEMQMVILHNDDVPGTTTPSLVTGLLVDARTGTQRRRNRD